MFKGLDLLFLEVNNLEESVAFYTEQLGFEIDRSNPESEPPTATLRAGNLKITLAQHLETMLRRGRGAHFFMGVDDVDAYYEQLQARGLDLNPRRQMKAGAVASLRLRIRTSIVSSLLPGRTKTELRRTSIRAPTTLSSGVIKMALQHAENLFRRYRGQVVTVKTMSGSLHVGRVTEVTKDFVELVETKDGEPAQVFLLFHGIESMVVQEPAAVS